MNELREITEGTLRNLMATEDCREALDEVIRRYRGRMLSLAYGRLHDWENAEDAVQDACLVMWIKIQDQVLPDSIGGWVYSNILAACDSYPAMTSDHLLDDESDNCQVTTSRREFTEISPEELRKELKMLMRNLTTAQREVVEMRYLSGKSTAEIAEELGISQSNVGKMLARAKARLCALFGGNPTIAAVFRPSGRESLL